MAKLVLCSTLVAAALSMPGTALASLSGDERAVERQDRPHRIILAQSGEVDIFYDRQGRRVLVDRYTGEVIGIERPRWLEQRRIVRREYRDPYGTDPQAEALDRYDRNRALLRGQPGYVYEEDRRYLDDAPLSDPYRDDFDRDEQYGGVPEYREQPYPGDGLGAYPEPDSDRALLNREPVLRQPLPDNPTTGTVAPRDPVIQEQPPVQSSRAASEDIAKLQVLLDRAGSSPGVIDGRMGSNVAKALRSYVELTGRNLTADDKETIDELLATSGGPAYTTYTISPADAAGPFVASVPADYGEKAKLERLGYTSVVEMLAERFHMDEAYLRQVNPGVDFNRPGTQIKVASPGQPRAGSVARIVADKRNTQVRAYDASGNLVAAYPATIGSSDTPSPSGSHTVERIAFDPEYTYNPKVNFKQGNNDKVLRIPPGPNGPVGSIWIALSKPTYGIHGTPEPSKIGKTNSHGCVRLTNWDAQELAKLVSKGVTVEFAE